MKQEIIKTLANGVRLQLLLCIGEKGKSVTELINSCGLSQSAVSQHLSKLKDSGLVIDQKDGRSVIYQVKDKKLLKISKDLLDIESQLKNK